MSNGSKNAGGPLLVAALILAVGLVAGAFVIASSVDRATEKIDGMATALADIKGAIEKGGMAGAAAAAPRPSGPDPARRYTFKSLGPHVKGAEDAKVTIVEFSDFQCPFCSRVVPTIQKITETYGKDVKVAFKHLPLDFHTKAPGAAAAATAAGKQGKFWEMHDKIFLNQQVMSDQMYEQWAKEIGLNVDTFKKDVASADVKKLVDADKSEAASMGVTGTPAFFINGRYLSGAQPFESFQRIIDEELKKG
jgi:protein-disulfide isomerase